MFMWKIAKEVERKLTRAIHQGASQLENSSSSVIRDIKCFEKKKVSNFFVSDFAFNYLYKT